jgi:hypothetical protein
MIVKVVLNSKQNPQIYSSYTSDKSLRHCGAVPSQCKQVALKIFQLHGKMRMRKTEGGKRGREGRRGQGLELSTKKAQNEMELGD